jgi:hypothetical protein
MPKPLYIQELRQLEALADRGAIISLACHLCFHRSFMTAREVLERRKKRQARHARLRFRCRCGGREIDVKIWQKYTGFH